MRRKNFYVYKSFVNLKFTCICAILACVNEEFEWMRFFFFCNVLFVCGGIVFFLNYLFSHWYSVSHFAWCTLVKLFPYNISLWTSKCLYVCLCTYVRIDGLTTTIIINLTLSMGYFPIVLKNGILVLVPKTRKGPSLPN